jgi:DNA-binding transcriptional LysR family regulator
MGAFCRHSDRTSAPGNQRRRLTLPPTLGGFWVPHFTAEFARCWPRLSTIFPKIALVVLAYVIYRKGRSSRLKRAPSLDVLV